MLAKSFNIDLKWIKYRLIMGRKKRHKNAIKAKLINDEYFFSKLHHNTETENKGETQLTANKSTDFSK